MRGQIVFCLGAAGLVYCLFETKLNPIAVLIGFTGVSAMAFGASVMSVDALQEAELNKKNGK